MRSRIFIALVLVILLAIVGCSSPLSDDDDATSTAARSGQPTPTATSTSPDAATGTPVESTPSNEPGSATQSATPTRIDSSTSTADAAASFTPTTEPLPAAGAELRIDGASVTRIVQAGDSRRSIYAVADGVLWRSDDGGQSWSEAGEGDIGSIVVALNEPTVIYAGDRGGCGRGFSFYDFRRSFDAGRNWDIVDDNADLQPLLGYESPDHEILYATNCGLSVSTDAGTTWDRLPELNGEDVFAAATERSDPMDQIIIVAATEGGTGRLFLLDATDPAKPLFVDALAQFWGDAAVDWTEGRILLANAHRIGVSDDNGETWAWSRDGLEKATYSNDPLFEPIPEEELDPFRRMTIAHIDPTNRDHLWIGGSHGAYLSLDGGSTWRRVGDDVQITGLAITTLTDRVMISSESGTRIWSLNGD